MRVALWLALVLAVNATTSWAQQAEVRISAGPHYVGVPIDLQLSVEGFERSPEPTVEVDVPAGTSLELVSVSPNFSTSIQIINGEMTQSESIRFVYRYRLVAEEAGPLELGPFRVIQGGTHALAPAGRFDIGSVPETTEQRFRLLLPEATVWVGQRVPVKLEWWMTESFAERLAGRRARVPLFDYVDRFRFEDEQITGARSTLTVDTAGGPLDLPMTVGRGEWQGNTYLVVAVERTMIPLKSGSLVIEPASIVTEETVRWSTDFFGNRVPAGVRRLRVEDQERTMVVAAPPTEGRPASFSGAVGNGFSVAVSADRSVVQIGDPIRLSIDVRGDAALDTVALPRLAVSGLNTEDFKIPGGQVAGVVEDGVKRFEVVLRVRNEQVLEIPPIALSWFNPELGQYETTHSRPIALSVRAANMVTATDVVRTEAPERADADNRVTAANQDPVQEPDAAGTPKPAFTLSGAELAIETRPGLLQSNALPWYARPTALGALYLSGIAVLGSALITRRRASLDPAALDRRRTLEAERDSIAQATDVGDLARALRRMVVNCPGLPRDRYEAVLVDCDNLSFAPGAGRQLPVDPALKARALAVAEAILESSP